MAYRSDTIATVLKRLNAQYFLPAIQRQFIWRPDQVVSLFDSILRGYPIGSFLFWELEDRNRDKWESYEFVENAIQGGTRNSLASTTGVRGLTLILDGQQRLTSLLVGLKGTYKVKKKYGRRHDPTSWTKQRLYLDLLHDPKGEADDGEAGIHYGLAFFGKPPADSDGHYWFQVGRILDFDNEDRFHEFKLEQRDRLPDSVTKRQMTALEMNLERLFRSVWRDDVVSYYMELDQDYDRVLDIFVRANEGGTKLNKSDLLLSMVTSKWSGTNAREEIYDFVERLNNDLSRKNALDKDFIMKSCLVLSDLSVAYKVQNFNNENLALIRAKWDTIKGALERAVDVTNVFGIDRDTLTSANALIPIAYYFMHHPGLTLHTSTPLDVRNAAAVRRWFTSALLNGVFGGSSDTLLTVVREVLQRHAHEDDFPMDDLNKAVARSGRKSTFDDNAIDDFLSIQYGGKLAFLALSLLYDDNNWGTTPYHQDHIFPKSMFTWSYMKEHGFSREQFNTYGRLRDFVSNLELLVFHENQEKLDMPFDKWIGTRDASFKKRHLIPDEPELWKFENFERFVDARELLIAERLFRILGVPVDESGS